MEKELPHNTETEQSLLWAMLIDEDIINLIDLKQKDFYDNNLGRLFWLMKKIKSSWSKVDLVIIYNYLQKNNLTNIFSMSDLVALTEIVPTSSNWKTYQEIIRENSHRRQMILYARQIESLWYSWDMWNALDKIDKLTGITYKNNLLKANKRYSGLIAQEVNTVLPEVVYEDENGYLNIAYGNLTGLIIEAIKELRNEIKELKK